MIFLYGKDFDLTVEEPNDFVRLLNKQYPGSQLGRLPIAEPKDNDKNNLILAISIKIGGKENRIVGRISLESIDYINRSAELKIFITQEFQSKGYGKSACKLIMDHGFNNLGLNRIYAGTLQNNDGFIALAKSLGFHQEGIRKSAVFKDGKFVDVIEFGIVKSDIDMI